MKSVAFSLALAVVTACGTSKSFKGEAQTGKYSSDAEPAPEPIVQTPAPVPVPKPSPVPIPKPTPVLDCPNPVVQISAGSFTIWTEPPCPRPFEVYEVVIRVEMPPDIAATYNPRDLSGSIIGTDGFAKGFGPGTGTVVSLESSPQGGILHVPLYRGADIVNETVQINSSILLEFQSVVIEY